ncbi:MAG: hypothetical protein M1837_005878 [Sclerophora amabilis]|nr:MAG: hypothetical protein M1837_005878 [Sclerophora amabilis]
MARRRKNLSEKRNEEEKMDTINKLLKKQAPKQRRGRALDVAAVTAGDNTPNTEEPEVERPNPLMVRWVSNREGSRLSVPEEWLGAPIGRIFQSGNSSGRMVEEVN